MRRRTAPPTALGGEPVKMPPDVAHGPDPAVWAVDVAVPPWLDDTAGRQLVAEAEAVRSWQAAGERWGAEHGLRHGEWRELLPPAVAYAVSVRGRLNRAAGQLKVPWER
ncbi:MAG: hypothetical protein H0X18_14225 [Geodermatophilaceae bacterium]|nr:hypothetical protein [Geodermatophilaceae bacterium]